MKANFQKEGIEISIYLTATYRNEGQEAQLDFHDSKKFEIFLFHSGKCRYLVGNQIFELVPGDLLLLDGTTVQRAIVYDETEPLITSTIHFDPAWLLPLLEDLKIDYLYHLFSENRKGFLRRYDSEVIKKIAVSFLELDQMNFLGLNHQEEAMRKLIITELLLRIDNSSVSATSKTLIQQDEKVRIAEEVLTYILRHYREAITIEDVANGIDLSKSYISHIFKEVTGYSIMNFLMRYRLFASADALLVNRTKTIKEIAFENGFESDAHFSRFFRKIFGQTPNGYRKNYSVNPTGKRIMTRLE